MKDVLIDVNNLVGTQANELICGGNFNGSVVVFVFDEKLVLTVQCCWRLIQNGAIIASWNEEDNSIGSNFELTVSSLEKDLVSNIKISNFFDLDIVFKSGKIFQIFCDINRFWSEDYFDMNWYICDKEKEICCGVNRDLQITKFQYT